MEVSRSDEEQTYVTIFPPEDNRFIFHRRISPSAFNKNESLQNIADKIATSPLNEELVGGPLDYEWFVTILNQLKYLAAPSSAGGDDQEIAEKEPISVDTLAPSLAGARMAQQRPFIELSVEGLPKQDESIEDYLIKILSNAQAQRKGIHVIKGRLPELGSGSNATVYQIVLMINGQPKVLAVKAIGGEWGFSKDIQELSLPAELMEREAKYLVRAAGMEGIPRLYVTIKSKGLMVAVLSDKMDGEFIKDAARAYPEDRKQIQAEVKKLLVRLLLEKHMLLVDPNHKNFLWDRVRKKVGVIDLASYRDLKPDEISAVDVIGSPARRKLLRRIGKTVDAMLEIPEQKISGARLANPNAVQETVQQSVTAVNKPEETFSETFGARFSHEEVGPNDFSNIQQDAATMDIFAKGYLAKKPGIFPMLIEKLFKYTATSYEKKGKQIEVVLYARDSLFSAKKELGRIDITSAVTQLESAAPAMAGELAKLPRTKVLEPVAEPSQLAAPLLSRERLATKALMNFFQAREGVKIVLAQPRKVISFINRTDLTDDELEKLIKDHITAATHLKSFFADGMIYHQIHVFTKGQPVEIRPESDSIPDALSQTIPTVYYGPESNELLKLAEGHTAILTEPFKNAADKTYSLFAHTANMSAGIITSSAETADQRSTAMSNVQRLTGIFMNPGNFDTMQKVPAGTTVQRFKDLGLIIPRIKALAYQLYLRTQSIINLAIGAAA